MSVASLKEDMAFYDEIRADLELEHLGKWVLIYDRELIGTFDEFQDAGTEAIRRFGRGPFHIKRIGEGQATMPLSAVITHRA